MITRSSHCKSCMAHGFTGSMLHLSKAFIVLIMMLCAINAASATVDLLAPQTGLVTKSNTVAFEFYVSMQNLTGCSLSVGGNQFPDPSVQSNTMHSVTVNEISDGNYNWSVSCTGFIDDAPTNMSSTTRTLLVDTIAPNITIVSPVQSQSYKNIPVDFIPYDDSDDLLSCTASWNDQSLQSMDVARNFHHIQNYTGNPGQGTLTVRCVDDAGNEASQSRSITYVPDYSVSLQLDKTSYGLAESVKLTVNTIQGANTSIDVCPDQQGFVQCSTAILPSTAYPQTITLPYLNKTGQYLVEVTARYANQTKINRTKYNVTNSMYVEMSASPSPKLNNSFTLSAKAAGGIAPYRINWRLSNGTTIQDVSSISMRHASAGTYTHLVTVFDSMNNSASTNYTYTIKNRIQVSVKAVDAQTGVGISKAEVSADSQDSSYTAKTGTDGLAYIDLEPDDYKLFVTADGYKFGMLNVNIPSTGSPSYSITLQRDVQKIPVVSIVEPPAGASLQSPFQVQFNVQYEGSVSCVLYENKNDGWFESGQKIVVQDASNKILSASFDPGIHILKIGCVDDSTGRSGTSSSFNVDVKESQSSTATGLSERSAAAGTSEEELLLQKYLDAIEIQLSAIDSKGQREKEAISLIGYDRQLRNVKRSLQQSVRDMSDIQFRDDLDDEAKSEKRKELMQKAESLLANTPQDISVKDMKSYVRYLGAEDVSSVSKVLAQVPELSSNPSSISKYLLKDQQKFTISTKLIQAEYSFGKSSKSITIISRTLTYAKNLSSEYAVYELVPSEISSVKDLTIATKCDVISEGILKCGQEQSIVYIIPKKVDFTKIEDVKTVLARPRSQESLLTGFAIFGASEDDGISVPMILLIALFVIAYLVYYFDIGKHARYLYYKMNKNSKLHYVRVMVGDANDQLAANNYERADMIFKEIHMTYDTLPLFAKNELYEEIMDLVHKMDSYYFNMVMLEFDSHMKSNDLSSAIESYEKLLGVYSRLDASQQEQLSNTITALAHRLGVRNDA